MIFRSSKSQIRGYRMSTRRRRRRSRSMSWSRFRKLVLLAGLPLLLILLLPLAGSSPPPIKYTSEYKGFDPALKRWIVSSSSPGSSYRTSSSSYAVDYRLSDLVNPMRMFQPRMSISSFSKQLAALTSGLSSGVNDAVDSYLEDNFSLGIGSGFSLTQSIGSPRFWFPGFGSGGGGGGLSNRFASTSGGSGGGGTGPASDTIVKPEYLEPPGTGVPGGGTSQNDPSGDNPAGGGGENTSVIIPEPQSYLLALFGILGISSFRHLIGRRLSSL